jgi:hypothetical protein
MPGLRKWICELMIYDAGDASCTSEANKFMQTYNLGAWTVDIQGVKGFTDLGAVLVNYVNINQLTFTTHGFAGRSMVRKWESSFHQPEGRNSSQRFVQG